MGRLLLFLCLLPMVVLDVLRAGEFESMLPVFERNCVQCHGKDGKVKGKVNLLEIRSVEELEKNSELLGKLIDAIDFEEMPPEDEPQLEVGERVQLLKELEALRQRSVEAKKVYPHAPLRRMNRFQYDNAVTDLFQLRRVVFSLPERMLREYQDYFRPDTGKMADVVTVGSRPLGKSQMIEPRLAGVAPFPQDLRAEHGFDNRGDHLSMSPLLMESFLKLGQSVVGSDDFTPKNVGVWKEMFAEPAVKQDVKLEVRMRLKQLLLRAFRRPVESGTLDRYVRFVEVQMEAGLSFTDAMKAVAAAVISSPRFLYLYDDGMDGENGGRVGDYELASRLSFFLWGSIPDEELLNRAASGELRDEVVLREQFERMLRDQKLKRFCDSFPAQWLQLERIISSAPSGKEFPSFYFSKYRASMHMMIEPLLIFETVLVEDLPVTQLIDSDFTYRSGLLEKVYQELATPAQKGAKPKNGSEVQILTFYRQPVTDRRNGGVITNAAVMTMTSGPERTQPITRGAWVAGVIFNNPPEPPPANVPVLGEKPLEGEEHLTLRERLAMHRQRADCKGCHEQIDPLGFALENFDPIGNWRSTYENGREVDMRGTLFRKHEFGNVVEFKDAILAEKDRFTRGLAGHLLSFALARELGAADQIALDQMAEETAENDYRMKELLRQVVFSEPFLSKSSVKQEEVGE